MSNKKELIASQLLRISAVKVQPSAPFTWASGWLSPFYCDNRKALSFPDVRELICNSLCELANNSFDSFDVIAGVATGAIAQGALVADRLKLPFVYVRSSAKDHGLANLIEGHLEPNSRILVVEDLISTGGSSLKAVEALRSAGAEVVGMIASFTYGFPIATEAFEAAGVRLETLTDYPSMLKAALSSGYIQEESLATLESWRESPSTWGR